MCSSKELDNYLVDKAKQAGAEVLDGLRANKVEIVGNEVEAHTKGKVIKGKILLGADGPHSMVARSFGLAKNKVNTFALESQVFLAQDKLKEYKSTIKVDYGLVPKGYTWMFPKTNLCLLE